MSRAARKIRCINHKMKFKEIIPREAIEQIINDYKTRQPADIDPENTRQNEHSVFLLPYYTIAGTKEYFPVCSASPENLGKKKTLVFSDADDLESILDNDNTRGLVKKQFVDMLKNLPLPLISLGSMCAVGLVPYMPSVYEPLVEYAAKTMQNPYIIVDGAIMTFLFIATKGLLSGFGKMRDNISNIKYIDFFSCFGGQYKHEIKEIFDQLNGCETIYSRDTYLFKAFNGLKPDENISGGLWNAANAFVYFHDNMTGPASTNLKSLEVYRNIVGKAYTE